MMVLIALLGGLWLTVLAVVFKAGSTKPDIERALNSDEVIVNSGHEADARHEAVA
ncbi:hypothetical protein [Luteococcus sp. OSA5]|uniref:hypothetical protein n=1 Tax=Luteococcus sp. OSA5 TaxID=3401630 RepID=UPI003B431981